MFIRGRSRFRRTGRRIVRGDWRGGREAKAKAECRGPRGCAEGAEGANVGCGRQMGNANTDLGFSFPLVNESSDFVRADRDKLRKMASNSM
jgi:hypothetical protein